MPGDGVTLKLPCVELDSDPHGSLPIQDFLTNLCFTLATATPAGMGYYPQHIVSRVLPQIVDLSSNSGLLMLFV